MTETTGYKSARLCAKLTLEQAFVRLSTEAPLIAPRTSRTMWRWESDRGRPSILQALALAEIYGCTLSDLDPNRVDELADVRRLVSAGWADRGVRDLAREASS